MEPRDDVLTSCNAINSHASQRYFQAAEDLRWSSWCFGPILEDREWFLLDIWCMMSALVEIMVYRAWLIISVWSLIPIETNKVHGHGLLVFLEDAVSILNLSVLVLAGNFRLKFHSGNSLFHHLLEHDLLLLVDSPRSFPLASIVQWYFLPLIGSLR